MEKDENQTGYTLENGNRARNRLKNRARNDIMTPYWGSVFFAFFAQGATMIQENVV